MSKMPKEDSWKRFPPYKAIDIQIYSWYLTICRGPGQIRSPNTHLSTDYIIQNLCRCGLPAEIPKKSGHWHDCKLRRGRWLPKKYVLVLWQIVWWKKMIFWQIVWWHDGGGAQEGQACPDELHTGEILKISGEYQVKYWQYISGKYRVTFLPVTNVWCAYN